MKTCPHCGYENPDSQVLCIHCSLVLSFEPDTAYSDEEKEGTTQVLSNVPRDNNVPRWGTASLGRGRKILLHARGYDKPLVVPLKEQLVMGRYDSKTRTRPDISLDDFDAAALGVSRRHAAIIIEDDGLKLIDLSSANSTFINGQKLVTHQARILRDGDEIRLGRLVIRVSFA